MDKRKYFVSVGSGEVNEDPYASSYQFEIAATPGEAQRLSNMFDDISDASRGAFMNTIATEGPKNQSYHETLQSIYQTIHHLGNDGTRQHIESMNILP